MLDKTWQIAYFVSKTLLGKLRIFTQNFTCLLRKLLIFARLWLLLVIIQYATKQKNAKSQVQEWKY